MDLNLGATSGVQAIAGILARLPETRILVLSASGEHADVLEAVKAGATGYLVKSAGVEELLAAVRRTADGYPVFTPGLAGLVLGEYRRLADEPEAAAQRRCSPSGETEVLRLVAKGLTAARSGIGCGCRTAPWRATCRTRCASCSCCTTGPSWSGTRSSRAWPTTDGDRRSLQGTLAARRRVAGSDP